MRSHEGDWLKVVYGRGVDPRPGRPSAPRTEIAVRQTPAELDLTAAPGREHRVRVTVVPSERAQRWSLWLRDFDRGPVDAAAGRVWWRVDPGTWQPLGGARQCVAEGQGRVRLDVSLRFEGRAAVAPRLRFVAEMA